MSNDSSDSASRTGRIISAIRERVNPSIKVGANLLEIIVPNNGNGKKGSLAILGPSTDGCTRCQEDSSKKVQFIVQQPIQPATIAIDTSSCTGCEGFTLIPELDEWLNQIVKPTGVTEVDEFDLSELACAGFFNEVEELQEEIPSIKLGLDFPAFPKAKVLTAALPSETPSGRHERIALALKRSVHPPIPLPADLEWRRHKDRKPFTEIEETATFDPYESMSPAVRAIIENGRKEVLTQWMTRRN